MGLWELGVVLYVFITGTTLVMAWREQVRNGSRSYIMNALSFLACTLWPLVIAVFLVAIWRQRTA